MKTMRSSIQPKTIKNREKHYISIRKYALPGKTIKSGKNRYQNHEGKGTEGIPG